MKEKIIVLAGNPNVGKSTVFNSLTGLHQHTGNWTGKTVSNAEGIYKKDGNLFKMIDLPGTYSIHSNSEEEEIARDFICFEKYDSIIVVCDAVCLMRNLNLVLQICEITNNVVVCVNMIDEAKKKKISIDLNKLSNKLNIKVIGTIARDNIGIDSLIKETEKTIKSNNSSIKIKYDERIEKAISIIEKELIKQKTNLSSRFIAINLLGNNSRFINKIIQKEKLINTDKINIQVQIAKAYLKLNGISLNDIEELIVTSINDESEKIYNEVTTINNKKYNEKNRKIDKILTNKVTGIPIMLLLFGLIFWITIVGSNYPSGLLQKLLLGLEWPLYNTLEFIKIPSVICDLISHGMYRVLAWVVSVMLPPMAIFFPLFTFLEDIGYLPRIAFNVDGIFKKCNTCGKQALTMAMGFGCNAVGVSGCRIIDSKRERLIAILTNSFVPCNGRFPILISIISMFLINKNRGIISSIYSVLILLAVISLGFIMTFFVSKILSKTFLKGYPSSFVLELPPYRRPQIGKIIVRSLFDRTLFVLGRAVSVAIPAGIIIWILANTSISNNTLLLSISNILDPFAKLLGMDGTILLAFILGFPANEIVVPIIIMGYLSTNKIMDISNLSELKNVLINNGWSIITAISVMVFTVIHWPCSTTCLTIKKETKSLKWTVLSVIIPCVCGMVLCVLFNIISRFLRFCV